MMDNSEMTSVNFKISEADKRLFRRLAADSDMNMTDYLRYLIHLHSLSQVTVKVISNDSAQLTEVDFTQCTAPTA